MAPTRHCRTHDEARAALVRLCDWEGLARSERLRGLLTYLLDEALAGRGLDVKAKTIGMDVYGYDVDALIERESVVRVDVGRLRRKIEEFYLGDGQNDPLRFELPKGAYAMSVGFSPNSRLSSEPSTVTWKTRTSIAIIPLAAALAFAALVGIYLGYQTEDAAGTASVQQQVERSAIFDASPARLRAVNLAEVGRDLIFPAINPDQLATAQVTFEAAINADTSYFGGYAGTAQVAASLAILTLNPDEMQTYLS